MAKFSKRELTRKALIRENIKKMKEMDRLNPTVTMKAASSRAGKPTSPDAPTIEISAQAILEQVPKVVGEAPKKKNNRFDATIPIGDQLWDYLGIK